MATTEVFARGAYAAGERFSSPVPVNGSTRCRCAFENHDGSGGDRWPDEAEVAYFEVQWSPDGILWAHLVSGKAPGGVFMAPDGSGERLERAIGCVIPPGAVQLRVRFAGRIDLSTRVTLAVS